MNNSKELIERFRRGQEAILLTLGQIQVVVRSYPQAKQKLRELNEKLLAHLGLQTDSFFKKLSDSCALDHETRKMLEFLTHDLKDLKIKYLIFFDKHTGEMGVMSARTFLKDFNEFSEAILMRMKIEEDYLFPLLKRLEVE